jgi:outer membrane cobalamin receptor
MLSRWFCILVLLHIGVVAEYCVAQTGSDPSGQTAGTPATISPYPKQDLVVTVSSQALPISASASSVTIIPDQQIRDSGTQNVADILRQVPFLHMQRAGGEGGLTTVYIRGAKENLVMVMIDGVPVNDITNTLGGSFDFSTLSTDNVERIEIVRGPMSALYGSEAVAGVINIISRRHEDTPYLEFNADGGNFGTGIFGTNAAGRYRIFDYALGGSYERVGEQIGLDSLNLGSGSFTATADLGNKKFLEFHLRYQNRETTGYPEGSGGPEFALLQQSENDHAAEFVGGVNYQQQWKPWWLYSISFDGFHRGDRNFTPEIPDQIPPTFDSLPSTLGTTEFDRLQFQDSNSFRISSSLMAHLNIGWHQEHGTTDSILGGVEPFSFDLTRNAMDQSTELVYSAKRFTAVAGLGINKTEGYAGVFSPRVGLNYALTSNTHLKGTWGKGFFIPSFYALSEPVIGNPKLLPEYNTSFDVGIEHKFLKPHLQVSTTYFHDETTNLVDFDSVTFQLVNRDDVITQGIEFSTNYDITSRLQLGSNVSWLEWSLKGTTQPLRYLPHWQGGADLDWRLTHRLHSRIETQVVGSRFDFQIPVPQITTVGGYSTTNLIMNYEVNDALSAHLRAENLFNSNYHEYVGFPNPGIYVRAGITYRFKPGRP